MKVRPSEKMTSSAVTGAPLENFASRRWNVYVLRSAEIDQLFASPGETNVESLLMRVSWSKICWIV